MTLRPSFRGGHDLGHPLPSEHVRRGLEGPVQCTGCVWACRPVEGASSRVLLISESTMIMLLALFLRVYHASADLLC